MPRLTAPRRQAEVCAPLPAAHAAARYARHLPERTLLYALVQAHYPDQREHLNRTLRFCPFGMLNTVRFAINKVSSIG